MFADDVKMYTDVITGDDIDALQECLDLLSAWARTWQLEISLSKSYTFDVNGKNCGEFCENLLDCQQLENMSDVIDLGIQFDSKLTFTLHINQIVSKAKQRIFLLFCAFPPGIHLF